MFDLEGGQQFSFHTGACDMVTRKITYCELEGGTAAALPPDGLQAAALLAICEAGDHIVASQHHLAALASLISVTKQGWALPPPSARFPCAPREG